MDSLKPTQEISQLPGDLLHAPVRLIYFMKIKPCKKCGSTNVKLWDCGYSSFNPGGGKCECGREVKGEAGCSPSQDDLTEIWNEGQKLTTEEKLRAENKRLRAKVRDLIKSNKCMSDPEPAESPSKVANPKDSLDALGRMMGGPKQ